MTSALSEAKINVEYAYGSTNQTAGESTTLYVRVTDTKGALTVLKGVEGAVRVLKFANNFTCCVCQMLIN